MRTYLMALGFDIWGVVKNGYTTPTTPPMDATGKSCIVFQQKIRGTNYIIYIKGMIRSRRQNYKPIEDNLRPYNEIRR
jgi:hypothetical protein